MYEVCVIGGGISGMTAAITAARRGKRVAIIDRNPKLGRKLYATGNGRCNITNEFISYPGNYYSSNDNYLEFLHIAMGDRPKEMVFDFLNQIGVRTKTINGYIYPTSMQASSFVWALIDELNNLKVDIFLKTEVNDIKITDYGFRLLSENRAFECNSLILSCGGRSYRSLGATDRGYELCRKLGHSIVRVRPSLCGMKTKESMYSLTGVRAASKATLYVNDMPVSEEKGELQFTEYGLSGIMIFNLSSKCGLALSRSEACRIQIDFAEDISPEYLKAFIKKSNRSILGCINAYLNDKLCTYILNGLGINPKQRAKELDEDIVDKIVALIKGMNYEITALCDYENAQVCAGGVELSEITPESFQSKRIKGLYLVGEMLDIDGQCGGYNITFAICSGIRAGKAI